MIRLLHIENIAVIEKADIEFGPGLNVMTGETGAGKSIVIDAISAVTGGRTSREIIRTGEDYVSVTAVFSGLDIRLWLDENGIEEDESGELYIMRKITSDGKNSCRINGIPVSTAQLRELGSMLLDIHGQNDGRKLLDESSHLRYLDEYGGHTGALEDYRNVFSNVKAVRATIDKLTLDESEKERRIDTLKYQIDEIERAGLRPGEKEELTSKRGMLLNASKLTEAIAAAHQALYGGDDTEGALTLISGAYAQIEYASRYADSLRLTSERLQDLQYTAQDIADELRDIRGQLDFKQGDLEELEARLDVLRRISRKYGEEIAALEHLERCKTELADIEDSSDRLLRLENELKERIKEAVALARNLSDTRRKTATTLQEQVAAELQQLNMPGVRFLVEFANVCDDYSGTGTHSGVRDDSRDDIRKKDEKAYDLPDDMSIDVNSDSYIADALNSSGCDEVRFLLSANAGEAPGKISRIASGGELSRIMLALKNVLGAGQEWTTVFDEIDAGVSGIAAQRVGEKLSMLARNRQVLCVTHLPQIAVMADSHFQIQKSVDSGRTFTHIMQLDFEGQKKELARLSGGENVTETTLRSAEEQLAAAGVFKAERNELR